MQDHCMEVPLGLPGLEILYQRILVGDGLEVTVQYKAEAAACPFCGRKTSWVHATTSQRKKDRRIWDRPMILVLRKRRFHCFPCHKVFSEADPVFGFRRRSTVRLRQHVARRAAFQPVTQVARQEGVSPSLVRRSFSEAYRPRLVELLNHPQASPILGLDEFSRARGRVETVVDTARVVPQRHLALGFGWNRPPVSPAEWLGRVHRSRLEPFRGSPGDLPRMGRGDPQLLLLQGHRWSLEEKNNRIKVIKRLGNGYRNADNLQIRILLPNRSQGALT